MNIELNEQDKNNLQDKLWRMENLYHIEDQETKKIILFKLNRVQRQEFDKIQELRKAQKQVKRTQLKARQLGMTTFYLIYNLDDVLFNENYKAGLIAHDQESMQVIFRKVKVAWENFPMKDLFKNDVDRYTTTEIAIRSTNSSLRVALSFRSGTLNSLHVSELAKMSRRSPIKAEEVITGAFPSVVQDGGIITVESTAEGVGGHYYELYTGAPQNGFSKVFYPWYEDDRYQSEPRDDIPPTFDYLLDLGCNPKQVSWYYQKYLELGEKVYQEYPSTADEAFLQSGRPVFNPKEIQRCSPIDPLLNHGYAAGLDTATGSSRDWSVITIFCKETGDQVYTYRSQEPIPVFAKIAVESCQRYNNALLNIELNGVGLAMKQAVDLQGYTYLYRDKTHYDEVLQKYTEREGTMTTVRSKPMMIEDLKSGYRTGYLKLSDQKTYDEHISYQYDDNDKMSAPEGSNDDCVMACALAVRALHDVESKRIKDLSRKRSKIKQNKRLTTAQKIARGIL